MSDFTLAKAWEPYGDLMSIDRVREVIAAAMAIAVEPVVGIVPSIRLLPDGVKLSSLFLFTDSLLSEVSVTGTRFDYISRAHIYVLEWTLENVELKTAEGDSLKYQSAELNIYHDPAGRQSMLQYVGSNRDHWMATVTKLIPTWLLRTR